MASHCGNRHHGRAGEVPLQAARNQPKTAGTVQLSVSVAGSVPLLSYLCS
jgi:hypothetical protein